MNDQANEQLDPQLEALLDEAMSAESLPGGVPDDLAQRIIARTSDSLPVPRTQVTAATAESAEGAVIAKIGPAWLRRAAAAIVLAASVGVVLVSGLIARDAQQIVFVRGQLKAIERYELPTDPMSEELAILDMQLRLALGNGNGSGGADLLDDELIDFEWSVGNEETGALF